MTVEELIELLRRVDGTLEVFVRHDVGVYRYSTPEGVEVLQDTILSDGKSLYIQTKDVPSRPVHHRNQ